MMILKNVGNLLTLYQIKIIHLPRKIEDLGPGKQLVDVFRRHKLNILRILGFFLWVPTQVIQRAPFSYYKMFKNIILVSVFWIYILKHYKTFNPPLEFLHFMVKWPSIYESSFQTEHILQDAILNIFTKEGRYIFLTSSNDTKVQNSWSYSINPCCLCE